MMVRPKEEGVASVPVSRKEGGVADCSRTWPRQSASLDQYIQIYSDAIFHYSSCKLRLTESLALLDVSDSESETVRPSLQRPLHFHLD